MSNDVKLDGFFNAVFGQGFKKTDPFAHYGAGFNLVTDEQCSNLYAYNGIAKNIIDIPANDAVRKGFKIKFEGDDDAVNRTVKSLCEDLEVEKNFSEALAWSDLFGGALIVVMANDGNTLEEPLNYNTLKNIEALKVFDRVCVTGTEQYNDATAPEFMNDRLYQINNYGSNPFWVHESRVLRFNGGRLPMIQRNLRQGWGAKKFEAIKDDVFRYGNALEMAIQALCRLSEDILKLDGMTEILAMDGGDEAIQRRLHLLDMSRHLMNTIAIDGTDEYDRKGLSLAGIKDIIEKFETALCADTGIPATRLFGRSPDGMNSTGESDENNYFSLIERRQEIEVKPRLVKLVEMLGACSEYKLNLPPVWSIDFESLSETSKKDKAEIELKKSQAQKARADALVALLDAQVLDGIEARETIADDKEYKLDRSLDGALQRNGSEQ